MELLAAPLGFVIGLTMGAVGGGGSTLTVPLLVYIMGLAPRVATTTSLAVVGSISLGGAAVHWKNGRVRIAAGTTFGLIGVIGSVGGSYLNRAVDPDILLLSFSALMVVSAWGMSRSPSQESPM